jgi:hypothetical protein
MSTSAKRSGDDAPDGGDHDASYKTGGNDTVPVVADDNPVDSGVNPETADSDEQLGEETTIPMAKVHSGC